MQLPKNSILVALASTALFSCTTTTTNGPVSAPSAALSHLPAVRGWLVVERGQPAGSIVSYRSESESSILYAVRNRWNQDIGKIDSVGRAWRHTPHEEDQLLRTGTVLDGAKLILGLSQNSELEEKPLEALQSAVTRRSASSDG